LMGVSAVFCWARLEQYFGQSNGFIRVRISRLLSLA
jgi:hypothetical protein